MFSRILGTITSPALAGMVTAAQAVTVKYKYFGPTYESVSANGVFDTSMRIDGYLDPNIVETNPIAFLTCCYASEV